MRAWEQESRTGVWNGTGSTSKAIYQNVSGNNKTHQEETDKDPGRQNFRGQQGRFNLTVHYGNNISDRGKKHQDGVNVVSESPLK